MKKIVFIICAALFILCVTLPLIAAAESYDVPLPGVMAQETVTEGPVEAPPDEPLTPFTWEYLASIAGATAATLLIVQFLKVPLDYVFHVPTRLFVYVIALAIMLVATALTSGLTVNSALLAVVNAFVVALAAYGSYELSFAKLNK